MAVCAKIVLINTLVLATVSTMPILANTIGTGTQNFQMTTSGLDFFTVESAQTIRPGTFHLGTTIDYMVNATPYYDDKTGQNHGQFNDGIFGASLVAGTGLTDRIDFGVAAPYVIASEESNDSPHGRYERSGRTEYRASSSFRITDNWGLSAHASINELENNPQAGRDGNAYSFVTSVGHQIANFSMAANAGYSVHENGDPVEGFPVEPTPNLYLASLALGYLLTPIDTSIVAEIYGNRPDGSYEEKSNRVPDAAEYIAGVKWRPSSGVTIQAGGGGEILHGANTPDWRAFVGISTYIDAWTTPKVDIAPRPKPQVQPRVLTRVANEDPPDEQIIINDVLFDFDSAKIKEGAAKHVLGKLATKLRNRDNFGAVVVEGHTCSIGTAPYNQRLSQRRALAVQRFLVEISGIASDRIIVRGKGEAEPIANNANYVGRQLNRRVVFKLYDKQLISH